MTRLKRAKRCCNTSLASGENTKPVGLSIWGGMRDPYYRGLTHAAVLACGSHFYVSCFRPIRAKTRHIKDQECIVSVSPSIMSLRFSLREELIATWPAVPGDQKPRRSWVRLDLFT